MRAALLTCFLLNRLAHVANAGSTLPPITYLWHSCSCSSILAISPLMPAMEAARRLASAAFSARARAAASAARSASCSPGWVES